MVKCDCYSGYTDEDGKTVHYADCAIILDMLESSWL